VVFGFPQLLQVDVGQYLNYDNPVSESFQIHLSSCHLTLYNPDAECVAKYLPPIAIRVSGQKSLKSLLSSPPLPLSVSFQLFPFLFSLLSLF
jgi:hypothetical protein